MHVNKRIPRSQGSDEQRGEAAPSGSEKSEQSLSADERISRRDGSSSSGHKIEAFSVTKKYNKVALVHDWLNGMRGGEIVFEALMDLYPSAEIFTLIYEPENFSPRLREKLSKFKIHTSFLNRFSFTRKRYRQLLPILPFAIRSLNLKSFDLIISSSHCVAKGVKKDEGAFHLSYIHAPMRYMWDRFEDYFGKGRIFFLFRVVAILVRPFLQWWDFKTAQPASVNTLVANSGFIAEQIKRNYKRDAKVIYPFARLERFKRPRKVGNFYLMVGAFAPYKKTDLAIRAFARLGLPLKIVGQGQDQAKLWQLKLSLNAKNIELLGNPNNEVIETLYSECKAFIFPGKEDFGITPLEAMASGAPVIAFGEGGACETVTEKSGILFTEQTVESLSDAVMEIESGRRIFNENEIRERANFFTEARFKAEIQKLIT